MKQLTVVIVLERRIGTVTVILLDYAAVDIGIGVGDNGSILRIGQRAQPAYRIITIIHRKAALICTLRQTAAGVIRVAEGPILWICDLGEPVSRVVLHADGAAGIGCRYEVGVRVVRVRDLGTVFELPA